MQTFPTTTMIQPYLFTCLALAAAASSGASGTEVLYTNDFESAVVGGVPAGFLVLTGDFAVRENAADGKYLELPGVPLESHGVVFGPSEGEGIELTARFFGTQQGRRQPSFGLGLCGVAGYHLILSPSRRLLVIQQNSETRAQSDFPNWQTGKWYLLKLQISSTGPESSRLAGKAWVVGTPEPEWQIVLDVPQKPFPGQPSLWGIPYSGTPIRFDDVQLRSTNSPANTR